MTFFVVRHKETGKVLPQLPGRGYSGWHPKHSDPNEEWPDAITPRLFSSKQGASKFIEQWAKGIASSTYEYDDYTGAKYRTGYVNYEVQPQRSRDQLEIVPAYLQFGNPL